MKILEYEWEECSPCPNFAQRRWYYVCNYIPGEVFEWGNEFKWRVFANFSYERKGCESTLEAAKAQVESAVANLGSRWENDFIGSDRAIDTGF